jgi:hypothetical protein
MNKIYLRNGLILHGHVVIGYNINYIRIIIDNTYYRIPIAGIYKIV